MPDELRVWTFPIVAFFFATGVKNRQHIPRRGICPGDFWFGADRLVRRLLLLLRRWGKECG